MAGLLDSTDTGGGASDAYANDDFLTRAMGLLGRGVGGGSAGVANLTPAQEKAANTRSLMNFGIALMANAGPTYGPPRTAGQMVAAGLAAGQASRNASEEAAASAHKEAFTENLDTQKQALATQLGLGNLDVNKGTLGVSQGELALKLREFQYRQQLLQRQLEAGDSLIKLLTGQGGAGGSGGSGGSGGAGGGTATDAGDPAWLKGLGPLPTATADIGAFKDPTVRDKIILASKTEGVDPNLALATALRESQGTPNPAPGDGGRSRGTFQIGHEEAQSVGVANPDDPDQNIIAGVRYLGALNKKYGGNPANVTLAYAAGQGRADDVLAGKSAPPPVMAAHVANVKSIIAQNPAGAAAAGGAPGAPGAGGGDRGYDPKSGMRTSLTQGANTGPGGSTAPDVQTSIMSLPAEVRGLYAARLKAASGDPGQTATVMQDLEKAAVEYAKRPRYQVMSRADAKAQFQEAYNPTAIYEKNLADGSTKVTQQGEHPVNIADTPEAKAAATAQTIATKRLEAMDTASTQANSAKNDLELMKPLSQAAGGANALFSQYPVLQRWVQTLGIGTEAQNQKWTAGQALDAIAARMAFQLHPPGIGALSDRDVSRMLQSVPSMGDSPAAREMKIAILQTAMQRRVDENAFAQDYFMRPGHTLAGLDKAMQKELGPALQHSPPVANIKTPTPDEKAAFDAFRSQLTPGELYVGPDGYARIYKPPPPGAQ